MEEDNSHLKQETRSRNFDIGKFLYCDLCNKLCEQIPQKIFKNFQSENIKLNCLDANENLVALGSNIGHVYIFNRNLKKFSTIKGQDENSSIKLSRNLFYDQVAVGMTNGLVIVLQLPSPDPGLSKKLIEKSLKETHKSPITCLEWSSNGGKLFSSDDSGLVMMTLLDFENDVFYCSFVCCEDSAVMQMSFSGNFLAVSTFRRTILVDIPNDCSVRELVESGKNPFDSFGVVFDPFFDRKTFETNPFSLYVVRPEHQLWNLDDQGMIREKVVFDGDSLLTAAELDVPRDLRQNEGNLNNFFEFQNVQFLESKILATVFGSNFFILDIFEKRLVYKTNLFSKIKNFSCSIPTGEIFLLSGDRTILRLASGVDEFLAGMPSTSVADVSLISGGKSLLNKIRKLSNSTISTDANQIGHRFVERETNLSKEIDVRNIFIDLRRQDFRNGSGMSTPENYYDDGDGSSLNENDGHDRPWILSDAQTTISSSIGDLCDQAGTSNVQEDFPEESKNNLYLPVISENIVESESKEQPVSESKFDSIPGLFSSFIDTVGGFGARSETGTRPSDSDLNNVSVLRKFKKKSKPNPSPINLHPIEKLATPTEEQYSKNRFNPFDSDEPVNQTVNSDETVNDSSNVEHACQPDSPFFSRETLENFLESKLILTSDDVDAQAVDSQAVDDGSDVTPHTVQVADVDSQQQKSPTDAASISSDSNSSESCESKRRIQSDFNALLHLQLDVMSESSSGGSRKSDLTLDSDDAAVSADVWTSTKDCDIWNDVSQNYPVTCVSGSTNYVCRVDSRQNLQYTMISFSNFGWQTSEDKADSISVSCSGKIVWRLHQGTVWALVKPHRTAPKGSKWIEVASGVASITVCDHSGWYLKRNGDVVAQTDLRADRPLYKAKKVDCPYPVVNLSANNESVWALLADGRILVRTGISPANQIGSDWVDILPIGPSRIVSISLSAGVAWMMDADYRLWFCDGLSYRNPLGTDDIMWQVSLPASFLEQVSSRKRIKSASIFCPPTGLWVSFSKWLWFCRGSVTGHKWTRPVPRNFDSVSEFRRLCVSHAFDESSDCVWLQRSNLSNELIAFQPKTKMLHSLPPCSDDEPVAVSSSTGVLWILDKSGQIFVRHNVGSPDLPLGSDWQALDMSQLQSCDVEKFSHLCCSFDSVWACDASGMVYVRLGVEALTKTGLAAAWIALEKEPAHPIRRIFCSADGNFVWALSDNCKVLVRHGVTQEMPIGIRWVTLDDLKARHLAVGFNFVWALDVDYQVYCRQGVDYSNPVGNYWKKISGTLRSLSTTPANHLWGIDMEGRLVKHHIRIHSFCDKQVDTLSSDKAKDVEIDDFELI